MSARFAPGDYVVVNDDVRFLRGRRARVLGPAVKYGSTEPWPGYVNVSFDDGKPYRTLAESDLSPVPES